MLVRVMAVFATGLDVLMAVTTTFLMRMLHLHHDAWSHYVNKRDENNQEAVEDATHGWATSFPLRHLSRPGRLADPVDSFIEVKWFSPPARGKVRARPGSHK